jgi:hypothetical protein
MADCTTYDYPEEVHLLSTYNLCKKLQKFRFMDTKAVFCAFQAINIGNEMQSCQKGYACIEMEGNRTGAGNAT